MMNIIDLSVIIGDIDLTIAYLRDQKILKKSHNHCGKPCLQIFDKTTSDNWIFRCRQCRRKFSVRQDSIFSKSKLKLQNLLVLVYAFSNAFSVTQAGKLLKSTVSEHSIILS